MSWVLSPLSIVVDALLDILMCGGENEPVPDENYPDKPPMEGDDSGGWDNVGGSRGDNGAGWGK